MMGEFLLSVMSSSSWWLFVGALFMALEAFGIPGIGLLFAGLAAVIVGGVMLAGIVAQDDYMLQFSLWFATTTLFALLLWKPLKRWHSTPSGGKEYSNMTGDTATIVEGALVKGKAGKARWSGTVMIAELATDAEVDEIPEGGRAVIAEVRGTVLILKPMN